MNKIKQGNLNYDNSGRAYPDNPEIKENWDYMWENKGKYYVLVGDEYHKEWKEIDINKNEKYNQIIDEVYKNYLIEDVKILPNMPKDTMTELGYRLTQEEFINKCKTDPEFSKKWGLKIEERELSLEERRKNVLYFLL
jgi:hypothetical protein